MMSDEARDAISAIKKFVYDTAVIVLMNPNDLEEMSKSDFPDYKFTHAHFVAKRTIERGNIIILREDSGLKRAMYELIKENPEKEWSWKEIRNELRITNKADKYNGEHSKTSS